MFRCSLPPISLLAPIALFGRALLVVDFLVVNPCASILQLVRLLNLLGKSLHPALVIDFDFLKELIAVKDETRESGLFAPIEERGFSLKLAPRNAPP